MVTGCGVRTFGTGVRGSIECTLRWEGDGVRGSIDLGDTVSCNSGLQYLRGNGVAWPSSIG